MKTKFELSDLQVKMILAWKERHFAECHSMTHDFNLVFSEETGYCASIKCLKCNKGQNIYDFDSFDEERAKKYLRERSFDDMIFLGAGSYSTLECAKLHARLDWGISMLCGQQQNGGMGTEYDLEAEKEADQAIIDVIQDVATALGMKDRVKIV